MKRFEKPIRVVLDTNVLVRALANLKSYSGRIVNACESRQIIMLTSKPLESEYRRVLIDIQRRAGVCDPIQIEGLLRRLRYLGDYYSHVAAHFDLPRDQTDAKLIELAIEGHATHLITHDRDLLSLPTSRSIVAKRFRQRVHGIWIGTADEFCRDNPQTTDDPM